MRHVSPELALVDPEFAERLRASLPDPPDCLAARPRVAPPPMRANPVAPPPPLAALVPSPRRIVLAPPPGLWEPPSKPPRRFERALNTALWTPLAAVLGSSLLAFIPTSSSQPRLEAPMHPAPRSSSVDGAAEPGSNGSTAVAAPQAPARKPSRLVLRWRPVSDADFYDVVVVAGAKRRDFWPARNRLAFRRGDSKAGVPIRWYVYPAYRVEGVVQFGKLHAHGKGTAVLP